MQVSDWASDVQKQRLILAAAAPQTPRLVLGDFRPPDPCWGAAAPQTPLFVLGLLG